MTREIPLTLGLVALVDDADFEWLNQRRWHASKCGGRYRPRQFRTYMYRLIMGAKRGQIVDHINGDTLDNRRSNLRLCTQSQNLFNSAPFNRPKASRFKGVFRDKAGWSAGIQFNGNSHRRYFTTEVEAARWYDQMARSLFGEFARLNFPDEAA